MKDHTYSEKEDKLSKSGCKLLSTWHSVFLNDMLSVCWSLLVALETPLQKVTAISEQRRRNILLVISTSYHNHLTRSKTEGKYNGVSAHPLMLNSWHSGIQISTLLCPKLQWSAKSGYAKSDRNCYIFSHLCMIIDTT